MARWFATSPGFEEWRRSGTVVLSAHVGMATGAALYLYTSSLFVIPLSKTFGWSRGDIAIGAALGLLGSLSAPFIGRLADRYGARAVAAVSMLLLALVFVGLSQATGSYGQYIGLSALIALVAPGATAMVFSRAVTGWFDKSRGQALGVMAAGSSVGALIFTPLVAAALTHFGPQGGFLTLAALAIFIGMPVVLLGLRDKVAGSDVDTPGDEAGNAKPADRAKIFAALRSRSFVALATAVFVTNVPSSGILTQLEPLLAHNGVEHTAPLISMYAIVVLIGRLVVGWLFDRTDARYTCATLTFTAAAGCMMFVSGMPHWMILAGIVFVGLLQGMELDAMGYFVARQFDRDEYGVVFGVLLTLSLLGTAVGVVGFGMLYDATHSYDLALVLASGVLAIALVGYLMIPRQAHSVARLPNQRFAS